MAPVWRPRVPPPAKARGFPREVWVSAIVIIQGRLSSYRFPNKIQQEIDGKPLIEHVIRRCLASGYPVILAVPGSDDFTWLTIGHRKSYLFHDVGHDESDVLGRYLRAAECYVPRPDVVVRVTGDCPLIPPSAICAAAAHVMAGDVEYAETRSDPSSRPNGIDAQAFTLDLLRRADQTGEHREHLTGALVGCADQVGLVSTLDGVSLDDLPSIRLCVDTPEDLQSVRAISERIPFHPALGRPGLADLWQLYESEPDIFCLEP